MLEINDLKAQLQEKTIANAEMRTLLNKMKGKLPFDIASSQLMTGTIKHIGSQFFQLSASSNFFVDHEKSSIICGFGNDQFAPILRYRDLVQGNVTIKRIYYVEGLNHNLFSVGQFCDADLEVVFRKSTCFVRDLQGNNLLTGAHGSNLYTIALQEYSSPTLICFIAKASSTHYMVIGVHRTNLNPSYKILKFSIQSMYEAYFNEGIQMNLSNPLCTLVHEVAESFSHNIDTSNMHRFCQRHRSDYHWTRDHPLEQVCGNPSDKEDIKEAMVDHAWIEAMQEELNQFDRLSV
ncbi:hypothetical protein Tco_1091053 [Tanacetum coccineum]|uniref:Integrase, catalytic region, zinc finger, CCHC-type, peptidase aspartic, catalytic n=1 Tax=Tanacetum coccineum TaxID=301880 RepID=A0ABQ5I7B1_9ASTR